MNSDEALVRRCYTLAKAAVDAGNHPFGALLVIGGEIVLEAQNRVLTDQDVTRHAELSLVSEASRQFEPDLLATATLYTSTEPCAMCCGAIYWAGIRKLVYGVGGDTLGKHVNEGFVVSSRSLLASHQVIIRGPVLESEGMTQHSAFWH